MAFFCGKRQKPDNRYRYANEAQREKAVIKYFEGRQAALERKKEYNAKRNVASTLEVGHILTGSWGYDQTNPEAVEVVEVIGKNTVMIREIGFTQDDSQSEGGSSMSNYVIPNPGDYKSEPRKAKVQYGNSVKINDHCTGSIWNGRSQYNSWYA